jgi:O-antigen/teichoic acid export membrane protein
MKHINDFGIWNFFKTQLGFVAQHTDRFIIGRWLGTVSLGFYDKALTIAEMPYNTLTMNINGVMFSAFSRIKDDKLQLQQQFKKTLTLLSFLKFPIYFGLIVIAPYFVHSTLGDKWGSMIAPFQIILISYLFKSFGGMSASLNVGIGNYRNHTVRFLIAFVIFVLSCFLLLRFNITGIALGYLIFTIFQIIFSLDLSLKSIDLRWKDVWLSIWPGALASFFMFVIIFSITHFILTEYTFINMAITIFVGALSYCLFIYYDKSKLTLDFRELALADIKNIFQHIFNAA